MSIQDWPRSERSREKLIEKSVGSLSDAELLALFLQTGRREDQMLMMRAS